MYNRAVKTSRICGKRRKSMEDKPNEKIKVQPLTPAPLLIVLASFDPSGEGVNHYDPEHPELLTDKTSKYYGEQWAISKPQDCYDRFFGENCRSMMDFYKEMTGNKFWFYPVKIDHPDDGMPEEGVVSVSVPLPHPAALRNLEGYDNGSAAAKAIHDIVCACDKYIDFKKYDHDGDRIITPNDLAVIILNAGYDHSSCEKDKECGFVDYENGPDPSHRFQVHGTSQPTDAELSGGVKIVRVSNIGEYRSVKVGLTTMGTPAHELAHNLGAQDMYSRYTWGDDVEPRWPTPRTFSLMCNGNHIKDGNMPTYIDPYQRIYFGWTDVITADEDGIYTLKSVMTGDRVLKVPTPNPDEYFLFEIRLKKGFEEFITNDESAGGVVVYHIDEGVNREWFLRAQCVSSNRPEGKRHDLGNALKPRRGMEEIKDENGKLIRFGPLYSAEKTEGDPFFYKSDDPKTSVFDSAMYCGAASESYSLNSFPEGVSKDWHLVAEVLDPAGDEMRVRITRG